MGTEQTNSDQKALGPSTSQFALKPSTSQPTLEPSQDEQDLSSTSSQPISLFPNIGCHLLHIWPKTKMIGPALLNAFRELRQQTLIILHQKPQKFTNFKSSTAFIFEIFKPQKIRSDRPDSRQHQAALEGITVALFDKLRTTANFFMQLLTNIGQDAEQNADYELFERIKNMKLDLNHSIEMYNKKMEELRRSAASSIENSFHDDRGGPSNQQFAACSRCKLLECERDSLKAQLNREIGLKEEFLAQNEEQDKALREMRRQAEELRSELESGRAKVEEIEQKLQKTEEYYQTKYVGKQSTEQAELNEKVRVLRQRNIELDAKNEEILRAVQRFKELNQEELTNKDIEIQRLLGSLAETERRCKQLEADYRHLEQRFWKLDMERQQWGKATNPSLEEELKKRDALVRKYAKKMQKLRDILSSYGHYFDQSVDYEALVERSTEILESKLAEGQRTASSASMAPVNNHHHHNHHNNRHPS